MLLIAAVVAFAAAAVIVRETDPIRVKIRSLRSGDDATRRSAAAQLNDTNIAKLGPVMDAVQVAMASDPVADVRAEATRTMGTLGSEAIRRHDDALRDRALKALYAAFNDQDRDVGKLAMTMLIVFRNVAVKLTDNDYDVTPVGDPQAIADKMYAVLTGPESAFRSTAATVLGFFPVQLDRHLPELLKAAAAEPTGGRPGAGGVMVGLLRKVRPLKPSVPLLVKSLDPADPRLRYLAIATLGQAEADGVDAVPDLIAILNDPAGADARDDPGRAAATALGAIAPGTTRAAEALAALHAASSSAPPSRERAIKAALAKFADASP